jgi:hypothetical protein
MTIYCAVIRRPKQNDERRALDVTTDSEAMTATSQMAAKLARKEPKAQVFCAFEYRTIRGYLNRDGMASPVPKAY